MLILEWRHLWMLPNLVEKIVPQIFICFLYSEGVKSNPIRCSSISCQKSGKKYKLFKTKKIDWFASLSDDSSLTPSGCLSANKKYNYCFCLNTRNGLQKNKETVTDWEAFVRIKKFIWSQNKDYLILRGTFQWIKQTYKHYTLVGLTVQNRYKNP